MLILRFSYSIRERFPEWVTSSIQTMWGLILLNSPELFQRPYYKFISHVASQDTWGWMAFVVGVARLCGLYINGSRRSTPQVRMVGAMAGMAIWLGLFIGGMSFEPLSPSAATYFGLFVLDTSALYFATIDAKANIVKGR